MRKISILGSTGSIGSQTLDVVRNTGCAEIVGLAAAGNIERMEAQIIEFMPKAVSVMDEEKADLLSARLREKGIETEVFYGLAGNIAIAALDECDMTVNSIVGSAGLIPTCEAIKAGKDIALANKETLVAAGEAITELVSRNNVRLIPVDSEHSAIFQCLNGDCGREFEKIYLTASGGPFRGRQPDELRNVTPEEALRHPNWSMGRKITVDSATLMNKGLEYIEAKWLFNAELPQIEILVHPQSVIHSMVQYRDGAVIAQIGTADMRTPIQYALTYPERVKNDFPRYDFIKNNSLTFFEPDYGTFPCLRLAMDAIKEGGLLPAVMNAANETAVERFLNKEIGFCDIAKLIEFTMSAYTLNMQGAFSQTDIAYVLEADAFGREYAGGINFA